MKFTKKDISDIKYFYKRTIMREQLLSVAPSNSEFTRNNLVRYGVLIGKILTTIRRRINFRKLEENKNADELIKETFGEEFLLWLNKINIMLNGNNNSDIDDSDT